MTTIRNILAGVAVATIAQLAAAASVPFSGTLSATDPTFTRPTAGNPPTSLSSSVYYDLFPFYVTVNDSYTLQTTSAALAPSTFGADDTFMVLYQTAFNPATPLVNALVADDDGGAGLLSLITRSLTAGTQYYMVVTSFSSGALGSYTGTITNPGNGTAVLGNVNAVPVPGTLALVPLGLLGLAASRRRRAA
jgi:hypothetical protein